MIFTNAYERNLDDKNRTQIPAEFRNGMDPNIDGTSFYICPGERQNTLSLYPERVFERRAQQLQANQFSGENALAFEQLYFSLASRLEWDKQGRVVLPERQLGLVDLGKEITLAGANDRIDVWNAAEYKEWLRVSFRTRWQDLHKFIRQAPDRAVAVPTAESAGQ